MNLKIIADENIPHIQALVSAYGEVYLRPGRSIQADCLRDADVLLVRSVTQVNERLLKNTKVKFVGSCTAGIDHVNLPFLQKNNIHFEYAAGSNGNSVAEYVLAALLTIAERQNFLLRDKTLAIVGYGHVGKAVERLMQLLSISVIYYDPFIKNNSLQQVSFEQALSADIICLHTPLTQAGDYPTFRMIGETELNKMQPNAILLNAGRGAVVDNQALYRHLKKHADFTAILDVWENEPAIDAELAKRCAIGTPHIAGYSLDSKINSAYYIVTKMMKHFNLEKNSDTDKYFSAVEKLKIENFSNQQDLHHAVKKHYDVMRDHLALQLILQRGDEQEIAQGFDQLRKQYPERREFMQSKN